MEYRKKERVTALAVFAGALLVLIYVIPNHIALDQEFELASLSPAFFPKLATWIIVGLAALLFTMTLTRKKGRDEREDDGEWLSFSEEWSAYRSFLVVIGYLFAMKYIGFLISAVMVLAICLDTFPEKVYMGKVSFISPKVNLHRK